MSAEQHFEHNADQSLQLPLELRLFDGQPRKIPQGGLLIGQNAGFSGILLINRDGIQVKTINQQGKAAP